MWAVDELLLHLLRVGRSLTILVVIMRRVAVLLRVPVLLWVAVLLRRDMLYLGSRSAIVHGLSLAGLLHDNVVASEEALRLAVLLDQVAARAAPCLIKGLVIAQCRDLGRTDLEEVAGDIACQVATVLDIISLNDIRDTMEAAVRCDAPQAAGHVAAGVSIEVGIAGLPSS